MSRILYQWADKDGDDVKVVETENCDYTYDYEIIWDKWLALFHYMLTKCKTKKDIETCIEQLKQVMKKSNIDIEGENNEN